MSRAAASNPQVDTYIGALGGNQRAIVESLRTLIVESAPKLTEEYKWGRPVYSGRKGVCYIQATKNHVTLGFYRGIELADPEGLLEGAGVGMRHLKIKPDDAPKPKALAALIRAAAKLDAAE